MSMKKLEKLKTRDPWDTLVFRIVSSGGLQRLVERNS
jgi:hypothetical protein